jgi:O-antigen ligase
MKKYRDIIKKAFVAAWIFAVFCAPFSRPLVKAGFCALCVLWLLAAFAEHGKSFYKKIIPFNLVNITAFVFLSAALLSVIFGENPYKSQEVFFSRYIPYFLFFWISYYLAAKDIEGKNLAVMIWALLASGILFSLGGFYDYLLKRPYRLFTSFGVEIAFKTFPLYVVYYVPLFSGLALSSRDKRLGRVSFLGLFLLVPCWIWQGSKAAWISVLASVSLLAFYAKRASAFILVIICVLAFFAFSTEENIGRILTVTSNFAKADRPDIMNVAWEIFLDYPLFGSGPDTYGDLFSRYWDTVWQYKDFKYLHAHNTYLELLAETGFAGFAAFFALITVIFFRYFGALRHISGLRRSAAIGIFFSITAVLIYAVSISIIFVGVQGPVIFWCLLGMLAGICRKGPDAGAVS